MTKTTEFTALITPNLSKILKNCPKYTKRKTISNHYPSNHSSCHVKFSDGNEFICIDPADMKFHNMQFTKLVLDKNIPQEVIDKEIMPKYIGRKDNIKWI